MSEWAHCPHYDLGPADADGVQICNQCGSAVMLRILGVQVDGFLLKDSTVVAKEGDDVPFDWPGQG